MNTGLLTFLCGGLTLTLTLTAKKVAAGFPAA